MLPSVLNWISPSSERQLIALCVNNQNEDKNIHEFNKNAVRILIKELRKSPKLINELERAITRKCSDSKCINISTTSERRLLVAHRRSRPQVVYCRLWRWPDLQSHHQIRSTCPTTGETKSSQIICINPYHYERNVRKTIDPILVPSSRIPPDLSTSFEDSEPRNQGTNAQPASQSFIQHLSPLLKPVNRAESAVMDPLQPGSSGFFQQPGQPQGEQQQQQQRQLLQQQHSQQLQQAQRPLQHQRTQLPLQQRQPQLPIQRQQIQLPLQQRQPLVPIQQQQPLLPIQQQQPLVPVQQQQPQLPVQQQQIQLPIQQLQPLLPIQQQQPQLPLMQQQSQLSPQHEQVQPPLEHQQSQPSIHLQRASYSAQPHQQQTFEPQTFEPQTFSLQAYSPQTFSPPTLSPHTYESPTHEQLSYEQQTYQQQSYQGPPYQSTQYQQAHPQSPYQQQQPFEQQPYELQPYAQESYQQQSYTQQAQQPYGTHEQQSSEVHQHQRSHQHQEQVQPQQYQPQYVQQSTQQPTLSQTEQAPPKKSKRPHQFRRTTWPDKVRKLQGPAQDVVRFTTGVVEPSASTSSYGLSSPEHTQQPSPGQPNYLEPSTSQPNYPEPVVLKPMSEYRQGNTSSGSGRQSNLPPEEPPTQAPDQPPRDQPPRPRPPPIERPEEVDMRQIPYADDKFWCSISYHEYGKRIGDRFRTSSSRVTIDGSHQPAGHDTFGIGRFENDDRTQFTEWVRRRIGLGAKFTFIDGDVYVENSSECCIFVSCPLQTVQARKGCADVRVLKLTLGGSAQIFSTQEFGRLLHQAVIEGFESVYKMTNRCVILMSFTKGWGADYKRPSIYKTPCWIELQLNGQLQWIDKVLKQMRPPTNCGSTSS